MHIHWHCVHRAKTWSKWLALTSLLKAQAVWKQLFQVRHIAKLVTSQNKRKQSSHSGSFSRAISEAAARAMLATLKAMALYISAFITSPAGASWPLCMSIPWSSHLAQKKLLQAEQ